MYIHIDIKRVDKETVQSENLKNMSLISSVSGV